MSTEPHNRLIAAAARSVLKPLGIRQKGRSRVWLDDQGWALIVIEFQPSSYDQGSYLNVGVSWLFAEQDHLSFDIGYREEEFATYLNEAQFAPIATRLAERAAEKVGEYRSSLSSLSAALRLQDKVRESTLGGWAAYSAAFLAGLAGDLETARTRFNRVLEDPARSDWEKARAERVHAFLASTTDAPTFRATVSALVTRARALKKLEAREVVFPPV